MTATQRLDRAQRMLAEVKEARRGYSLAVERLDRLERECFEELRDAREARAEEQAHHMDPHPRPVAVIR